MNRRRRFIFNLLHVLLEELIGEVLPSNEPMRQHLVEHALSPRCVRLCRLATSVVTGEMDLQAFCVRRTGRQGRHKPALERGIEQETKRQS